MSSPDAPVADIDDGVDAELAAAGADTEVRVAPVGAELHGKRLDLALVELVPEFSRSHLQSLISQGEVQVDGAVAGVASRKLRAGQAVAVRLVPPQHVLAFRPQAMTLALVHEDQHLLVIDKPVGLVVHPAPGNWNGTLLNGLLARYPDSTGLPRGGIVHRLDKDTSGLMVVARSAEACAALTTMIAERRVSRRYLAIAHGRVGTEPFTVDRPIGRDPSSRIRMAVVGSGKSARTDVYPLKQGRQASAVECVLHTGRTHQIRVHLAQRGNPLVADVLYGGREALGLTRQALHAARLGFDHPITGEPMSFESALPPDLSQAWDRLDNE